MDESFPTNISPGGNTNSSHIGFWYLNSLYDLQEKCKDLENKLNKIALLKKQAPFSPLEKSENMSFNPRKNKRYDNKKTNIHLYISPGSSSSSISYP